GRQRGPVAGDVSCAGRRLSHHRPQLIFTRAPVTEAVAPALRSRVPDACSSIFGAFSDSETAAWIVIAPPLLSIVRLLPEPSSTVMPSSSICSFLPSL